MYVVFWSHKSGKSVHHFVYHVFLLKTPSCFTQMSQSESTYRIAKETDFVNENGPGL